MSKDDNKIFVALDVKKEKYFELKFKLKSAKAFKIGYPLFFEIGKEEIINLKNDGKTIFLDFKFFDIPNTMIESSKKLVKIGVDFFTVHTLAGEEHLKKLVAEVKNIDESVKILGVTVLTSQTEEYTKKLKINANLKDFVLHLAKIADSSGIDGIVCSPLELEVLLKNFGKRFIYVTPGIRPSWAQKNDQKRTLTPKEAFMKGADYIVIGRPITKSQKPEIAFKKLLEEL